MGAKSLEDAESLRSGMANPEDNLIFQQMFELILYTTEDGRRPALPAVVLRGKTEAQPFERARGVVPDGVEFLMVQQGLSGDGRCGGDGHDEGAAPVGGGAWHRPDRVGRGRPDGRQRDSHSRPRTRSEKSALAGRHDGGRKGTSGNQGTVFTQGGSQSDGNRRLEFFQVFQQGGNAVTAGAIHGATVLMH